MKVNYSRRLNSTAHLFNNKVRNHKRKLLTANFFCDSFPRQNESRIERIKGTTAIFS